MANTIQIKRKTTSGAPTVGSLSDGEFCLVVPDEELYLKLDTGTLILVNDLSAPPDLKPYCVTGSGTDLTTTEATMAFSTEIISNANYSLSSNQITVTLAGTYQISYGIVVIEDGTAGGAREASKFHMEIGTTKIAQSEMANYNRETSADSGASITFLVELSVSDVLQLRGVMMGTPTDVSQGASQISILKVG